MVSDVIADVLESEAAAEKVLQEAGQRTRTILAEAGKARTAAIEEAREKARTEGETLLSRTREEAEAGGLRILADGREEAEHIEREATPRIPSAAAAVVKAVVGN